MDPSDRATELTRAISEGLNCLGVFLCGPAFARFRAEAPAVLHHWEEEHAPKFRQVSELSPGSFEAFRSALEKVSAMVGAGVDLESPEQMSALRGAIREMISALGFPLPVVPATEASVCELHGTACPVVLGEIK